MPVCLMKHKLTYQAHYDLASLTPPHSESSVESEEQEVQDKTGTLIIRRRWAFQFLLAECRINSGKLKSPRSHHRCKVRTCARSGMNSLSKVTRTISNLASPSEGRPREGPNVIKWEFLFTPDHPMTRKHYGSAKLRIPAFVKTQP